MTMTREDRCDILSLEWNSLGRDIDIVEPVLAYLEMRYGYRVARDSILDAYGKLKHYRPRLMLISNQGGASINYHAVKTAACLGVPVVSLVSEGDFPDDDDELARRFYWGWNSDRCFYEQMNLQWSSRAVRIIRRSVPESRDFDIRVSGATGFDRYKLFRFCGRDEFLASHGTGDYSRVVGVAGWTFDHMEGDYFRRNEAAVLDGCGGMEGVELHRRAGRLLREVLRTTIAERSDTLFILKQHPGVTDESLSEFEGLETLPNAVVLRGHSDNVADVVSACDLWLAYESTTCLEAWLLGKQTLLVNPAGDRFRRSRVATGSPRVRTAEELANSLGRFFRDGTIPGWSERTQAREEVLRSVIGWDDGLNHARAGEAVHLVLESGQAPQPRGDAYISDQARWSRRLRVLTRTGLIRLAPFASERELVYRMRAKFDRATRETRARAYADALKAFYAQRNIDVTMASPVDCPAVSEE